MNGWTILIVILLILVLISLIRVGAEVSYGAEGLSLRIRLGKIMLTILPKKEKPEGKRKKEKKPKEENKEEKKKKQSAKKQDVTSGEPKGSAPSGQASLPEGESEKTEDKTETGKANEEAKEPEKENKGGLPIPLMDLISIAVDAVGQVLSHLQIDVLHIEYTIGGKTNPANAAIQYGMLYAGGGAIVPVLENTFYSVKKREIHATVNFESDTSLVYLCLGLSICIGQVFAIAGHLGWAFLKSFMKKQRTNQQEGKKNGTEASDQ